MKTFFSDMAFLLKNIIKIIILTFIIITIITIITVIIIIIIIIIITIIIIIIIIIIIMITIKNIILTFFAIIIITIIIIENFDNVIECFRFAVDTLRNVKFIFTFFFFYSVYCTLIYKINLFKSYLISIIIIIIGTMKFIMISTLFVCMI